MTLKTARRVEIVGLFIVLLSAAWQFFVEEALLEIERRGAVYRIEVKLDEIWGQIGEIEKAVGLQDRVRSVHQPYSSAHERWQWAHVEDKGLRRQVDVSASARGIAFLVGSVMLLLARWRELAGKQGSS